jgi:hypothetical protein
MRAAINSLKSGKVIAPESTRLCIVLSAAIVRRADKAYRPCIEPTHVDSQRRMWVAGIGWEPAEGHWQETVSNPTTAALVAKRTTRKRRVVEEVETIEEAAVAPWQLPEPWKPADKNPVSGETFPSQRETFLSQLVRPVEPVAGHLVHVCGGSRLSESCRRSALGDSREARANAPIVSSSTRLPSQVTPGHAQAWPGVKVKSRAQVR